MSTSTIRNRHGAQFGNNNGGHPCHQARAYGRRPMSATEVDMDDARRFAAAEIAYEAWVASTHVAWVAGVGDVYMA